LPKRKQTVIISVRIPKEVYEMLKREGTISEAVREAILFRMRFPKIVKKLNEYYEKYVRGGING